MSKIVVAGRKDRLGARLRNLLYGWRLATKINAEFAVIWTRQDKVDRRDYNFFELFDREGISKEQILVMDDLDWAKIDPSLENNENAESSMLVASHVRPSDFESLPDEGRTIIRYDHTNPLMFEGETVRTFNEGIQALYRRLPIQSDVAKAVRRVQSEIDLSSATTLHIRRGDIISNLFTKSAAGGEDKKLSKDVRNFVRRYAPLQTYESVASEYIKTGPLAFFSDDAEIKDLLRRQFAPNVIDVQSTLNELKELSHLQRDFTELIIMSMTKRIVGTASHFCLLPAILGGIDFINIQRHMRAPEIVDAVKSLGEASTRYSDDGRTQLITAVLKGVVWRFKALGCKTEAARVAQEIAIGERS